MADDVVLRIGGHVKGLLDALKEVQSGFKQTEDEVGKSSKTIAAKVKPLDQQLTALGTTVTGVGMKMTALTTVPIVGFLSGAVKSAVSFETAFANVRKTVDASEAQLTKLSAGLRQMAKEIPASTEELSAIAAMAGQMGVKAQDIEKFTRHVAALGVAVDGISPEEAAMGLAQVAAVSKTSTGDIDKMSSALVNLGNNGNSTEGQILEFTKRLVGAGNQIGLTVPEIMALGSSMADLGINAEAGGTAFSTVMSNMAKAVASGGTDLEAFARVAGTTTEEFATLFKTKPIEAIKLFVAGLASAQQRGENLYAVLGDVGAEGIRMRDVLLRMAGAGDSLSKSLEISNEGWRTADKHMVEAEKKYGTTANQAKVLWNQVKDLGIVIGSSFLPIIKNLLLTMQPLIDILASAASGFSELPHGVQLAGLAILGLVAAGGPLLILIGKALEAAGQIAKLRESLLLLKTAETAGSATSVIAKLTEIGSAAASSTLLVRGLQAGLMGLALGGAIAVMADIIATARQLQQQQIQTTNETKFVSDNNTRIASQIAGRPVTNPAEVAAILRDEAARLRGERRYPGAMSGATISIPSFMGGGFGVSGAAGAAAPITAAQRAVQDLQALTVTYNADLKKLGAEGLAAVIKQHELYGTGLDKLAETYGVHQSTLERYQDTLKDVATAEDALADRSDANAVRLSRTTYGLDLQFSKAPAGVQRLFAPNLPTEDLPNFAGSQMWRLMAGAASTGRAGDFRGSGLMGLDPSTFLPNYGSGAQRLAGLYRGPSAQDGRWGSGGGMGAGVSTFLSANLGPTILSALSGGGNIGQSIGGLLGGGLMKSMTGALGKDGLFEGGIGKMLQGSFLGEKLGGALGSMLPGVGTLIGPLLGKGVSAIFGKLFGGEAKKTAKTRDAWVGETFGSADKLREMATEAGVADDLMSKLFSAKKVKDFEAASKAVTAELAKFNQQQEKQQANAQVFLQGFPKLLSDVGASGKLASAEFKDLLSRAGETGEFTGEINGFIQQQLRVSSTGILSFLKQSVTAYDTIAEKELALGALREQQDAIERKRKDLRGQEDPDREALDDLNREWDELARKRDALTDEIKGLKDLVSVTQISSQSAATGLSAALVASFTELQKRGLSAREALQEIGPAADALKVQLSKTGFEGGAAFETIIAMTTLARDAVAGPTLDAVHGLAEALVGLSNAGLLDQEMFVGLTNQITGSYNAMIAQGKDGAAALRMVAPDIQKIWELQQDFGYEVDSATQGLIDQGKEAKLVGEQHRTANDRIAKSLEALIPMFADFLKQLKDAQTAAGGIASNLNDIPEEVTSDVTINETVNRTVHTEDGPRDDGEETASSGEPDTDAGPDTQAPPEELGPEQLGDTGPVPDELHSGGMAGTGRRRGEVWFPWHLAPRFHRGGYANFGLKPGELPAVLKRGEAVLSERGIRGMVDTLNDGVSLLRAYGPAQGSPDLAGLSPTWGGGQAGAGPGSGASATRPDVALLVMDGGRVRPGRYEEAQRIEQMIRDGLIRVDAASQGRL